MQYYTVYAPGLPEIHGTDILLPFCPRVGEHVRIGAKVLVVKRVQYTAGEKTVHLNLSMEF